MSHNLIIEQSYSSALKSADKSSVNEGEEEIDKQACIAYFGAERATED